MALLLLVLAHLSLFCLLYSVKRGTYLRLDNAGPLLGQSQLHLLKCQPMLLINQFLYSLDLPLPKGSLPTGTHFPR